MVIDSSLFTWNLWRGGGFRDLFGIPHRTRDIVLNAPRIAQHVIGWAPAKNLLCRPKVSGYAIMLELDGQLAWCHVTVEEKEAIECAWKRLDFIR
jgi:hypothetical protein